MKEEILQMFRTEQYANEISSTLSNTEIDRYIGVGCLILGEAQEILSMKLWEAVGMTKEDIELDIVRIEYNLEQFTEAFMEKENVMLIMGYDKSMFIHMN